MCCSDAEGSAPLEKSVLALLRSSSSSILLAGQRRFTICIDGSSVLDPCCRSLTSALACLWHTAQGFCLQLFYAITYYDVIPHYDLLCYYNIYILFLKVQSGPISRLPKVLRAPFLRTAHRSFTLGQ